MVIPLHTQHYLMLQRNLLYTGITRGKKLVVLVGSRKALATGGAAAGHGAARIRAGRTAAGRSDSYQRSASMMNSTPAMISVIIRLN